MKKLLKIYLFSILMVFWAVGSASAISLGTNITIYDGVSSSTSGWWSDREDQEVEPNCVANQSWDLEGFFLDGTTLTMVGGFDFENGNGNYKSGDIFIDTDGNAQYGSGNTGNQSGNGYQNIGNNFGYEYALHLDFSSSQYTVYSLSSLSTVLSVYYGQNEESNPLSYVSGGSESGTEGKFTYNTGLNDSEVDGLQGGTHNAVVLDLSYLVASGAKLDNFTVHFTMGCGNDNLMGRGSAPVPEPATVMLVGTGLLGMIAFGRKRFSKNT